MHEADRRGSITDGRAKPEKVGADLEAVALEEAFIRPLWLQFNRSDAALSIDIDGHHIVWNAAYA